MEQIYTTTTIYNKEFPHCRRIEFYVDLDVAIKEVENNSCDMDEFSIYITVY